MAAIRSAMWQHFLRVPGPDRKAKCTYCHKVLSVACGSTGNLSRHLRKKHSTLSLEDVLHNREITPPSDNEDGEVEEQEETSAVASIQSRRAAKEQQTQPAVVYKPPKKIAKRESHVPDFVIRKVEEIKDEFSHFGNNVVSQLRELPLKEALICQNEVMEVLTKHRIAVLDKVANNVVFFCQQPQEKDHQEHEEQEEHHEQQEVVQMTTVTQEI